MIIAEVYYDRTANLLGKTGAWRARLRDNHGIHDCGTSREDVMRKLIVTAATHGYSSNPAYYQVTEI